MGAMDIEWRKWRKGLWKEMIGGELGRVELVMQVWMQQKRR